MSDEALEPCPFCKSRAVVKDSRYAGTGASGMETPEPYVECSKCGVSQRPYRANDWPSGRRDREPTYKQARAAAIKDWNTRHVG